MKFIIMIYPSKPILGRKSHQFHPKKNTSALAPPLRPADSAFEAAGPAHHVVSGGLGLVHSSSMERKTTSHLTSHLSNGLQHPTKLTQSNLRSR